MKKLDRKSIFIGLLIPITAIIFMGAVKNVLSRYHTIQAEEFQLVDSEGNAIFNLSEILTVNTSSDEESGVDYGPMIADLKSAINGIESSLSSITSSDESNNDFVSSAVFTKNIESIDKKIQNLSIKIETALKTITPPKKACGADCSKACCANKTVKKQCGSNCSTGCCTKKKSQSPNNDKLISEIEALRSDLDLLAGAFDSYTSTDSESNNKMSQEILEVRSELQRISDNQDILMKILKKDIKKFNKK